jgi:hypothetical protein
LLQGQIEELDREVVKRGKADEVTQAGWRRPPFYEVCDLAKRLVVVGWPTQPLPAEDRIMV